jgi:chromate transport protein ChrA
VNHTGKDPLQRQLEWINWIVLGVFVLISLILLPHKFTLGVLFGGFISIINFHWRGHDLKKVFATLSERAKTRILSRFYIRFGITAVALYFIVTSDLVDVIGLLVGLSTVLVNIILTAVMTLSKKNCLEEVK